MRLTYTGLRTDPQTFQPSYSLTETETGQRLVSLSLELMHDIIHGIAPRTKILLAVKQEIERHIGELSEEEINFIDEKIPLTKTDVDDGN